MSCAVLTAFTMEAYLNHVGPRALPDRWNDDFERKRSPLKKLRMICHKHGLSFPVKQRPWLSIEGLFLFRNAVAHGRSETLTPPDVVESIDEIPNPLDTLPPIAKWEEYCSNIENVQHAREDVEQVIRSIHGVVNPKADPVFSKGYAKHGITLIVSPDKP
jgi:hypothetical protein